MASAMDLRARFIGKPAWILFGLPAARSASPIVLGFQFPDTMRAAIPTFRTTKIAHEAARAGTPEDAKLLHARGEVAFLWHGSCQYEPNQ